ncbi:MAG: 16S rRNA (cytidine(1402)-2'-O)-methyltransferase [Gammaproteobacteria bacterium]|nr:16S rRNA (cytidine(1402)-2'-O)-methyltransferase [Gammaproteobacteria bacterium]
MSNRGRLYVVATPIGNLDDLSVRAQKTLAEVDCIAVEDTRHSAQMLSRFGIQKPLISVHEHNERDRSAGLVDRLRGGEAIALISDAGTPLISDPGFILVRAAREAGITVSPIPGPSAAIAALSVAGLPSDRFFFEGFLPHKTGARQKRLHELAGETATLIFYESPHRIEGALADMAAIFGEGRQATLARELTKIHETIIDGSLELLARIVTDDPNQRRGEIVLVVAGHSPDVLGMTPEAERVLKLLLQELPVKKAARLASEVTGVSRNLLYDLALHSRD